MVYPSGARRHGSRLVAVAVVLTIAIVVIISLYVATGIFQRTVSTVQHTRVALKYAPCNPSSPAIAGGQIQPPSVVSTDQALGQPGSTTHNTPAVIAAPQASADQHAAPGDSYTLAEQLLKTANLTFEARSSRIFVPLLTSQHQRLCNMLNFFQKNIARYNNAADIFVFSVGNAAEGTFKNGCQDAVYPDITLHFLALNEHWSNPIGSAADSSLWSGIGASLGYRQMGNWRLLFPFNLAHKLGYKYAWQLDDDSDFILPVNQSMIPWMKEHGMKMAFRKAYPEDNCDTTWGLPELARTFLVAERYTPVGPLLTRHVQPHGLDGLYTTKNLASTSYHASQADACYVARPGQQPGGGWDRMVVNGNCVLIDLSFWFQPLVQRFVELASNTQYQFRFRWNEQSVMAMVWQMFLPQEQSGPLPIPWNAYKHKGVYIPEDVDCNSPHHAIVTCPQGPARNRQGFLVGIS